MSDTFDREIVLDLFRHIEEHIKKAQKSFEAVPDVAFFRGTQIGEEKLASICMFLMVVGEQVRKIDKLTKGTVLSEYPNIDWQRIVSFRNIVAHDYVHIDSEVVFNICSNEIEPLLKIIKQIVVELEDNQ